MNRSLSGKLVIVSITLLLALLMSACGPEESSQSSFGNSPLTADELAKIDPDLLAVIEWEEAHSGKGREAAPDNFIFDYDGWIYCIVFLDPGKIVVTPTTLHGLPVGEQPAGRLIIRHSGRIKTELGGGNTIGCFIPLNKIKGLVQEGVVTKIIPNKIIPAVNE